MRQQQSQMQDQQREQRRNKAMKALAFVGPDMAQSMGYKFEPEALQEITAQPDWQPKLQQYFGGQVGGQDQEFLKEVRKSARGIRDDVSKKAASMRGDYDKITKLAETAKSGGMTGRAAVNSILANIVRLNSPGVVSESELKLYSGAQTPVQAILQWATSKGVPEDQLQAVAASFDASGNANVDGLVQIAGNLILGQVGPLFDQYSDTKERAKILPANQYETIFKGTSNIDEMLALRDKLSQPAPTPEEPKPLPTKFTDIVPQAAQAAPQVVPQAAPQAAPQTVQQKPGPDASLEERMEFYRNR
jgi:hypothetical protein